VKIKQTVFPLITGLLWLTLGQMSYAQVNDAQTPHSAKKLGRTFSQLENQASGWSTTYEPGSTEYWATEAGYPSEEGQPDIFHDIDALDERRVFYGALTHNDMEHDLQDVQIRVGQGSQIYSIITPFGEAIAAQDANCPEAHYWNDSVLQRIFRPPLDKGERLRKHHCDGVDDNGNTLWLVDKNTDIHQAGTYATDDLETSFFSPLLHTGELDHGISTVVWPPASHAPTRYESHLTIDQTITDEGNGVFKVVTKTFNFGDEAVGSHLWSEFNGRLFDSGDPRNNILAAPFLWTSRFTEIGRIRPESLTAANGGAPVGDNGKTKSWKYSDLHAIDFGFGGFLAMARPLRANSDRAKPSHNWGMAMVIGNNLKPNSPLRLGKSAGPGITMSVLLPEVPAKQVQTYTYFLVFGQLNNVFARAKKLVSEATLVNSVPDIALPAPICAASLRGKGWRSCEKYFDTGESGGITRGEVYRTPTTVNGVSTTPIFVLEKINEDGSTSHLITADPYGRYVTEFSAVEEYRGTEVMRPYGEVTPTTIKRFLGYGFTSNPGGCHVYLENASDSSDGLPMPDGVYVDGTIFVRSNNCL